LYAQHIRDILDNFIITVKLNPITRNGATTYSFQTISVENLNIIGDLFLDSDGNKVINDPYNLIIDLRTMVVDIIII
jgi:hypothetical protein